MKRLGSHVQLDARRVPKRLETPSSVKSSNTMTMLLPVLALWLSLAAAHRDGWIRMEVDVPSDARIQLTFALTPHDEGALTAAFHSVSDPINATGRFRQYLSKSELRDLVRPKQDAVSTLKRWWTERTANSDLSSHWISSVHGDLLHLDTSVAAVALAFNVTVGDSPISALL